MHDLRFFSVVWEKFQTKKKINADKTFVIWCSLRDSHLQRSLKINLAWFLSTDSPTVNSWYTWMHTHEKKKITFTINIQKNTSFHAVCNFNQINENKATKHTYESTTDTYSSNRSMELLCLLYSFYYDYNCYCLRYAIQIFGIKINGRVTYEISRCLHLFFFTYKNCWQSPSPVWRAFCLITLPCSIANRIISFRIVWMNRNGLQSTGLNSHFSPFWFSIDSRNEKWNEFIKIPWFHCNRWSVWLIRCVKYISYNYYFGQLVCLTYIIFENRETFAFSIFSKFYG